VGIVVHSAAGSIEWKRYLVPSAVKMLHCSV